ncbi:hypothetical protein MIND_00681100 [Mycena indigotica]|uniref:Translocon-associated protein subunit alpha n=1 Tax=Mycena indigotica TaxID=2126181 RepID=A0A8H6SM50_9AGAR|nr:uncharacterized protein MIND_00681100 [Mycena indigotica]KAF7301166.1 hypothetical protein MIND_00681100 [Mycena indigotica]
MRLNLILTSALSLAGLALSTQVVLDQNAQTEAKAAPETAIPTDPVLVTASFPETNAFGHIVNGEKNTINLAVENKSGKNVTLLSVGGAFLNAQTETLVKNLTAMTFKVPLIDSVRLQVPYVFYSEFKPGDIRLTIWLDHTLGNETIRVDAFDSIVTVVEPDVSLFDFKMITTYLMTAALLGGLGYVAYLSFGPKPTRKSKKRSVPEVSAPVGTVTATGAGGYQEEWIPEHHKRKPKTARSKSGTLTSGDEFSELSAGELSESAKKVKGKGRK